MSSVLLRFGLASTYVLFGSVWTKTIERRSNRLCLFVVWNENKQECPSPPGDLKAFNVHELVSVAESSVSKRLKYYSSINGRIVCQVYVLCLSQILEALLLQCMRHTPFLPDRIINKPSHIAFTF